MKTCFKTLNPWADVDAVPLKGLAPRLDRMEQKTIGLFNNNKESSLLILSILKQELNKHHPTLQFSFFTLDTDNLEATEKEPEKREIFEKWIGEVDAVLGAMGSCGPSVKFLVSTMIHVETLGKPGIALCTAEYGTEAERKSSQEMPGLRYTTIQPEPGKGIDRQIREKPDEIIFQMIQALTFPLDEEEERPKQTVVGKLERTVFQGTFEETNRFFYQKGWGDGLPIIPPTEGAVQEMLSGTDLPPDHVVTKVVPRHGKATIEKIAINSVMAGALPIHMPFIIAAVCSLMEPKAYFNVPAVSTAGYAPMWIVNGPVVQDINLTSGPGALSPGDISHAAIGRALGLIIKNIGGVRKGMEDHAVFGNPGRWSMIIAEDEAGSPWAPLHVDQGFKKEESTVTVFFPNSMNVIWPLGKDVKGILDGVVYNASPSPGGLFCLILPERFAVMLDGENWSKQQIINYIAEYARVPAYRHPLYRGGVTKERENHRPALNPEDPMPIWYSRDLIRVVVGGGPGNTMGLFYGSFQGGEDHDFATVKIELPKNWDMLKKRYGNITAQYQKY